MINTIIFFVAFASGIASFISSSGPTLDKRRKGIKRLTKRGRWYLLFILILVILPTLQNYLQEKENDKKEKVAQKDQDTRDANLRRSYDSTILVMKSAFDGSNEKTTGIISETLGKYGYQFDSANKKLIKLVRDSSKTKIIEPTDPIFSVDYQGDNIHKGIYLLKENDLFYTYKISFISHDAGSTSFNFNDCIVTCDSLGEMKFIGQESFMTPHMRLAKDASTSTYFNISKSLKFQFIYIWLKGTYKNIDGTKEYSVDDLIYYNNIGETVGEVSGKTKEKVIEFIKTNKVSFD